MKHQPKIKLSLHFTENVLLLVLTGRR